MTASLLALALASAILVSIPGPSVALIVATSLAHSTRKGISAVLGTALGNAMQLAIVVAGMAAVLEVAAQALTWIKWVGAAYLIWLGVTTWRTSREQSGKVTAAAAVFWRGAMTAALNPKTLLFNAAFLPQFVAGDASLLAVLMVGAVYLGVILLGDIVWAVSAGCARGWLGRFARWQNRVAGGFLVAAGVGLALSRRLDQSG